MNSRRGFLQSCLVLAAAPAIVRASSLMPVRQVWSPARLYVALYTANGVYSEIETSYAEYARIGIAFPEHNTVEAHRLEFVRVNGVLTPLTHPVTVSYGVRPLFAPGALSIEKDAP